MIMMVVNELFTTIIIYFISFSISLNITIVAIDVVNLVITFNSLFIIKTNVIKINYSYIKGYSFDYCFEIIIVQEINFMHNSFIMCSFIVLEAFKDFNIN